MIDIENEVFNSIATKLRSMFTGISVYGEEILIPSSFPCVTIVEADNYANEATQDSGSAENHARVFYEVDVYSNKSKGKKAECKSILRVIDEMLSDMGFTRRSTIPQTTNDATIYRIKVRYTAVVSINKTIYRR